MSKGPHGHGATPAGLCRQLSRECRAGGAANILGATCPLDSRGVVAKYHNTAIRFVLANIFDGLVQPREVFDVLSGKRCRVKRFDSFEVCESPTQYVQVIRV